MSRVLSVTLATAALAVGASVPASAQEVQRIMSLPIEGLSVAEAQRFDTGKLEFEKIFSAAEGLGPIFNDVSCATCHSGPLGGGSSSQAVTRFGMIGPPFDPMDSQGGSLLQSKAIDPAVMEFVPVGATVTAQRATPPIFGAGLVESIDDQDLIDLQNNPPSANVSGIAHIVQPLEGGPTKVGRFGWKAQVATMLSFSGDAGLNEMGITNALVGTENAPNGNLALLAAWDAVADPEDDPNVPAGTRIIDRWTDFQRFLAPPPQFPRSGMTGETLFGQVGCADCHVATFTTATVSEPFLSNKTIHPYSDFLLHDMGTLGDGIVQGMGTENEIRTAPLWGIAVRSVMLHDGRVNGGSFAQKIDDAINEHDGEALAAKNAYNALTLAQKDLVADFLQSLGRTEFDAETDSDVDEFDWFFLEFAGTFSGPAPVTPYTADDVGTPGNPGGALGDSDQDGDFDLADWGRLQRGFTGQIF